MLKARMMMISSCLMREYESVMVGDACVFGAYVHLCRRLSGSGLDFFVPSLWLVAVKTLDSSGACVGSTSH